MTANTRIATCCYCGTRAALELRGTVRHELACSSCGAPLHDLKMLRSDKAASPDTRAAHARRAQYGADLNQAARPKPKKSRKKRKSLTSRLFEEAFDVIEDIFD